MELPDLGTSDQGLREHLGLGPEWGWDKGITYDPGFAKFKLNNKGLRASGNIDPLNMQYDAMLSPGDSRLNLNGSIDPLKLQYALKLKQNGDIGLRGSVPLMGGQLNLNADRENDMNKYYLQYQRSF